MFPQAPSVPPSDPRRLGECILQRGLSLWPSEMTLIPCVYTVCGRVQVPERIPLDKAEFEAFLTENRALVERSLKLLERIDTLEKLNKELEEELKKTKEKLSSVEGELNADQRQASESLREARGTIARLLKETEKRVAH